MAKVTFDGPNKLIIVNSGVTELSVQIDLYSDWKEWWGLGDNSKYFAAFRTIGGDPLSPSVSVGDYYFLQNQVTDGGWRIRPYEGDHVLTITGNLVPEDATKALFTSTLGDWNVLITLQTSSLTQTAGGTTPSEIGAAVWDPLATLYNTPGTMGAKLNSAASAGDPWGTALPGTYPAGSAGQIVAKIGTDNVLSSTQQAQITKIGTNNVLSTHQNSQLDLIGTSGLIPQDLIDQINLIGTDNVLSILLQSQINKIGTDAVLSSHQNSQLDLIGTSGLIPDGLENKINLIGTDGVLSATDHSQIAKIGTNDVLSAHQNSQLDLIGTSGLIPDGLENKINLIGTDAVLSSTQQTKISSIGTDNVLSATQQTKINQIGTDSVLSPAQQLMILEIYKIFGLDPTKPLVVTPSSRTAGAEIQQVISGDPNTSVTVTRLP
jgi:hypothetical protein